MIRLHGISKLYANGEVRALDDVSLEIAEGEFVAVRGPSGSGKTTLLLTLGGMLHPDRGRAVVDGSDLYALGARDRNRFRAQKLGFVFQMYHLIPYLTVLENVRLAGDREAKDLLDRLGLEHRMHHKPSQLSAGERQRTAVARALVNRPRLVLADEPTGNLDPDCAKEVLDRLKGYHDRGGTVVVVTHGDQADAYATRKLRLVRGRLE
jgi:putative ABC transport system ATP-binding protein